jgi:CheY-like chemotaxis protein
VEGTDMQPDGQAPHILVANHAPEILELMRELPAEAGYRVSTMPRDGQDLDSIVALDPALIFIDYMWPSSDNEWTLLNLLRMDRSTGEIPVLLSSHRRYVTCRRCQIAFSASAPGACSSRSISTS